MIGREPEHSVDADQIKPVIGLMVVETRRVRSVTPAAGGGANVTFRSLNKMFYVAEWRKLTNAYYDSLHSEGADLLFCDGHAKWQKRGSIRFEQFGAPASLNPGLPTTVAQDDAGANAQTPLIYQAEF